MPLDLIVIILIFLIAIPVIWGISQLMEAEVRNAIIGFGVSVFLIFILLVINFAGNTEVEEVQAKLTTFPSKHGILQIVNWLDNDELKAQQTKGYFESDVIIHKSQYWFYSLYGSKNYKVVKK